MKKHALYITFLVLLYGGLFMWALHSYGKDYLYSKNIIISNPLLYLSESKLLDEIYTLLQKTQQITPLLERIEHHLHKNAWVKHVKVYQDQQAYINVEIEERLPILKIYREDGSSFFVDNKLYIMPYLRHGKKPNVPICMNFPKNKIDTNMLSYMREWTSQLNYNKELSKEFSYFHYHNKNTLELVPKKGSPIAIIPQSTVVEEASQQLGYFYEHILPSVGWRYYKSLDFSYKNQIISTKR